MDSIWHRLNPRYRLSAMIGWVVFIVVSAAAVAGAAFSAATAERQARVDQEQRLQQFAAQIMRSLQMALATRESIIKASAAQIVASDNRSDEALNKHLSALRSEFPEFSWIGVLDEQEQLVSSVGERPAVSGQGPSRPPVGPPASAIEVAVPLQRDGQPRVGVIVGALSWTWLHSVLKDLQGRLEAEHPLEVRLLDVRGRVLLTSGTVGSRYFLVGADGADTAVGLMTHWRVQVLQDAESSLAAARRTRNAVFASTLLSGILAALVAAVSVRLLLGRLRHLAAQAEALQAGTLDRPDPVRGHDEVAYIASTLAVTLSHLHEEKRRLHHLNSELDARVAQRTARIERMSEEARQAAVVRERLRMARELHDTLAHSLMALLTQLRMIRKLRASWSPQALDAELRNAESVAQTGLADARASIQQMRHNDVRELGLGLALKTLLQRFGERTGLVTELRADQDVEDTAGERAETVFRMVEEALRNIEKHARASHVRLFIGKALPGEGGDMSGLRIEIDDDGIGFDASAAKEGHFGLQGIQEQAELIGARLRIKSREGVGTQLVLIFEP